MFCYFFLSCFRHISLSCLNSTTVYTFCVQLEPTVFNWSIGNCAGFFIMVWKLLFFFLVWYWLSFFSGLYSTVYISWATPPTVCLPKKLKHCSLLQHEDEYVVHGLSSEYFFWSTFSCFQLPTWSENYEGFFNMVWRLGLSSNLFVIFFMILTLFHAWIVPQYIPCVHNSSYCFFTNPWLRWNFADFLYMV